MTKRANWKTSAATTLGAWLLLASPVFALLPGRANALATLELDQPGGPGPGGMNPTGPGGVPGGGQGRGSGANDEKKEGPAEEAPKDKQILRPIQPIPAQPRLSRKLQLLELHGYMRMRADYFHRLNLGIGTSGLHNPNGKFFLPPSEALETNDLDDNAIENQANCIARLSSRGVNPNRIGKRCPRHRGISSANMRLRLNPTLHVSDSVKVHATIDALDNLVLGSTPDSYLSANPYAPIDLYTRTQVPPAAGINSFSDSITVKRAYGDIHFGWGLRLQFGRMPKQWGLGIVYNDGDGIDRGEIADIVRMLDMDYGDSVDSLRLSYAFGQDPRLSHVLALSYDWAASGPTTAQLLGPEWSSTNRIGQEYSVEKFDNVHQVEVSLERRDSPSILQRKLSLGNPVLNYGLAAWFRLQTVDRSIGAPGLGDGLGGNPFVTETLDPNGLQHLGQALSNGGLDSHEDTGFDNYSESLVFRRALVVTPDLWARVSWRTLRVELEAGAVIGRFYHRDLGANRSDPNFEPNLVVATDKSWLRQFGYALEFKYGLFRDRFHLGLDHGFASGDESRSTTYDNQSPWIQQDGIGGVNSGDNRIDTFRFHPAYIQDLLLFREIMGTAANTAYFKPWAAFYFFQNNFSARIDVEYALAQDKKGTVGNQYHYGIELDGALRFHDNKRGVFTQLQYGVLFPFKALNALQSFGVKLKAAQSIQGQVGIRF